MILETDKNAAFLSQLEGLNDRVREGKSPDWLRQARQQGLARFAQVGVPSVKDEEWKYTNIAPATAGRYALVAQPGLREPKALREYCSNDDGNIVFVNGVFAPEFSNLTGVPKGVRIASLQEMLAGDQAAVREWLEHYDPVKEPAFVALNRALAADGAYIALAGKTVFERLIHIIHVTSIAGEKFLTAPRSLILLGESSEATVLESHVAFNDETVYLADPLTDIFLEENATLHYAKAQKESLKAFHVGATRVVAKRDSTFDGFSLAAGGAIARNNLDVVLEGEGASAIVNGLYSVYKEQLVDNHTSIDHRAPSATSTQLYKGILNDAARAVFNGKIFVRPAAQQTNSYQLNKNLLLGKDCRVDTKPQLEIFADDVKCTHGATIGQLDEDELFYLQARCISRQEAVRLLTRGFVDDLVSKISSESIRRKITRLLAPSIEALG